MSGITKIVKRDGRLEDFNAYKIKEAINKAFLACIKDDELSSNKLGLEDLENLFYSVVDDLKEKFVNDNPPSVEEIQDTVEKKLIEFNYPEIAKKYIIYRNERSKVREKNSSLMNTFKNLILKDSEDNNDKRECANINGDTSMGTMLMVGSEAFRTFNLNHLFNKEVSEAHINGDIYVHDMDFGALTTTCCQIDLSKLFKDGFNTGHGTIREPKSIRSACALTAIAIQANQNDQHGGQSIPALDYYLAPYISKSYTKYFKNNIKKYLNFYCEDILKEDVLNSKIEEVIDSIDKVIELKDRNEVLNILNSKIKSVFDAELSAGSIDKFLIHSRDEAMVSTEDETYQGCESLIHNLNSMNSRAGSQVPFSSVNFGTDTSEEGRMLIKNFLLSQERGLGHGETSIFPISIFKVKEGINYNKEDPNYDLFRLAMRCSAKRMFPNFEFIDAPFNLQYYKKGDINTEIATMGCRTRVIGNVYDPSRQIVTGRGNLSFVTISLPRVAIESNKNIDDFYKILDEKIDLCINALLNRLEIQSKRKVFNHPFLMGQGVWIDSEKLKWNDELREVLKHGSLAVGFIGLAEALVFLTGKHHGESEESQKLGLEIVKHMRKRMDDEAQKRKLNFSLLATPAESACSTILKRDIKKFGIIKGVTDREYYTNSNHVPVYYKISAFDKIRKEAPYHDLTPGGHICYVEIDGNVAHNIDAFEKIVRAMKEAGVGYGAINHPLDYDPVCGYNGVIGDICPKCGRKETEENEFNRIRRITGYLTGSLKFFNDGKKAEERDRVKHA